MSGTIYPSDVIKMLVKNKWEYQTISLPSWGVWSEPSDFCVLIDNAIVIQLLSKSDPLEVRYYQALPQTQALIRLGSYPKNPQDVEDMELVIMTELHNNNRTMTASDFEDVFERNNWAYTERNIEAYGARVRAYSGEVSYEIEHQVFVRAIPNLFQIYRLNPEFKLIDVIPKPTKQSVADALKEVINNNPPKVMAMEKKKMASSGIGQAFEDTLKSIIEGDSTQALIKRVVIEAIAGKTPVPIEVKFDEKAAIIKTAHKSLRKTLDRLQATKNILLVGEAGCGKTHLAAQVAEALSLPFSSVSCSSDMSSSVLLGWLLPVDGGAFEYAPSDFITLYENGGVFLLDEMDAADPSILLIINQALANGKINVPQRKGNTEVKRHDNFLCFAACNTFGRGSNMMYSGRERLDESTLDRFRLGTIKMTYDKDLEQTLGDEDVVRWAWEIRERINKAELKRVLSTRFIIDASTLKRASGATINEIAEIFFTGWKDDELSSIDYERFDDTEVVEDKTRKSGTPF